MQRPPRFGRLLLVQAGLCLGMTMPTWPQEAILHVVPVRPVSFDVGFSQRTFAPDNRVIGIQAGMTVLQYGNLEVRTI